MKRIFINTFLVIITLFLTSCSRGPEQETLQQDLQSRIDQRFGKGLLELTNFRRYGSQPLSSNDGRDQIAIYYRAELRLLKNHRFSDWSDKNISALHQVLGSAIKGVEGVVAKGNQAGDSLVAYGLSVYADDNENWLSVPFKKGIEADEIISEKVAEVDAENQLGQNSQAIWQRDIAAQLNHLSETSTDFNSVDQTNLRAELQAVLTKAKLKQLRKTSQTTLLSGSSKGNYHDLAQGISQVVSQKNKSFNPIPSSGAIENINLIEEELATFALTQSDLAAASFNGTNIFKNKKNSNLRAIAALYPEAVQIVIPKNSSIKRIADLNAKRVNLGASGTGTQANAKQILDIAGVSYENFSTMDFASS
ncbi:MAG: TAXI family TRAP transporter solute-binding subunit, partial [Kangiellaceae bacterium]